MPRQRRFPHAPVLVLALAGFLIRPAEAQPTRDLDLAIARSSRRASLGQWWNSSPNYVTSLGTLGVTDVATHPSACQSDGEDVWVLSPSVKTLTRIHASDGRVLGTWITGTDPAAILVAMGRVFVSTLGSPGQLWMLDPSQAPTSMTLVATLGENPGALAFDGHSIWAANFGSGSGAPVVSIVHPGATTPWVAEKGGATFGGLSGILFDGRSIWVTDNGGSPGFLRRLRADGSVAQSVTVGSACLSPIFDGQNIWVLNNNFPSISIVRASDGRVVRTLTGNGLAGPVSIAFDGQRMVVVNYGDIPCCEADSVSLWKASDFSPLGTFSTGALTDPHVVCSDGLNFWISLTGTNQIARY